ncbi:hypothetical protein O6450_23975, partial [Salmonella enterica subsp. enterica]
ESKQQISVLQQNNNRVAKELMSAQAQVEAKTKESEQLMATLTRKESEFQNSISSMKSAHEAGLAKERAEFERSLRTAKLSAEERVAK